MPWFAFDSHKHYTWALGQNEAGKHFSVFPPPCPLPPTRHSLLPLDRPRAFRDVPRDFRGVERLTSVT